MSGRLRVAPAGKSWTAGVWTCSDNHGRAISRSAAQTWLRAHSAGQQHLCELQQRMRLQLCVWKRRVGGAPGWLSFTAALRWAQSMPCQPALQYMSISTHERYQIGANTHVVSAWLAPLAGTRVVTNASTIPAAVLALPLPTWIALAVAMVALPTAVALIHAILRRRNRPGAGRGRQ